MTGRSLVSEAGGCQERQEGNGVVWLQPNFSLNGSGASPRHSDYP